MNAADRKQQKAVDRAAKLRRDRYVDALRTQMSTESGRLMLWELLGKTGITATCFDTQSLRMAALAGQQTLGFTIQAELLEASEDLYDLMAREARQRARKDAAEQEAFELDAAQRRETEE